MPGGLSHNRTESEKNMATFFGMFDFFLYATISCALLQISLAEENKSVTEECKQRCEKTYSLHTYPKGEPLGACLRGCRLAAIEQLSTGTRDQEKTELTCMKGCKEGYDEQDSLYACNVGCRSQQVIPAPVEDLNITASGVWYIREHLVLYRPVLVAREFFGGVYTCVSYYFQSSSATYYLSSDSSGTVMIEIEEAPQVYIQQLPSQDKFQQDESEDASSWHVFHRGQQWLQCVSSKSGIPFWLVSTTLFVSMIFLLWLCCATISTAPTENSKELSVDDLLLLSDEKLLLVREETDEAGPLPPKVQIQATEI